MMKAFTSTKNNQLAHL